MMSSPAFWEPHMRRALMAALDSPDPSTQNGALLLTLTGAVSACNHFPEGVEYTDARWERPLKYSCIEHAERNAIYKAASKGLKTTGSILVSPWAACADCARAIIQAKCHKLVRLPNQAELTNTRWEDSISIADVMMHEAGIEIIELDLHFGVLLRRDGQLVEF